MTEFVAPHAVSRPRELTITDPALFSPGREQHARLFARRVLTVPQLHSLAIDPQHATVVLSYRARALGDAEIIEQLARAAAGSDTIPEDSLPPWRCGEPVVLRRESGRVSSLDVAVVSERRLRASHPSILREPAVAARLETLLRRTTGVERTQIEAWSASVDVRFDPRLTDADRLLRLVETVLAESQDSPSLPHAQDPDFALAHLAVGVSAVGELLLPVALPAAAALLILSNLDTIRDAGRELRDGRLSLPVLYSTIVTCTVLSGSFMSAALMFWFFRYWERHHRTALARESQALIGEIHQVPGAVRVLTAEGLERLVPSGEIEAGQRIRVLAGEIVPADGRVHAGAALVEEPLLGRGGRHGLKLCDEEVLAGSRLVLGRLDLTAQGAPVKSHAARLAHAAMSAALPAPGRWSLTSEAERFAARTVPPTLAAAALGMATGGVAVANAVLRPDYATGIGLAGPLRQLAAQRFALRKGALVLEPSMLAPLAHARWMILDDHDDLLATDCDLEEFRVHGIAEDQLLPAAAAAAAWLGDSRGAALARACAARGLVARHAPPVEVHDNGLSIAYGRHVLRLRTRQRRDAAPTPIAIDVDGVEVARLRFGRTGRLTAADTVRQLQRLGLRVLLASSRSSAEAARRAGLLGADAHVGALDARGRCDALRALHVRGTRVVHVRDGAALPHRSPHYLAISIGAGGGIRRDAGIALVDRSIEALPDLVGLARRSVAESGHDRRTVVGSNLLAVGGVLALGWTGLAVVMISNAATFWVHDRARRSLDQARRGMEQWPAPLSLDASAASAVQPETATSEDILRWFERPALRASA